MTFGMSKLHMVSVDLRGRRGQPQVVHDLGMVKCGCHAKFHCPWLDTVDLYREQSIEQEAPSQ